MWEQEEEEEYIIKVAITNPSLSLGELRDMQKDFSCHPRKLIITWLLQGWNNGGNSLELERKEGKQLGSLSR